MKDELPELEALLGEGPHRGVYHGRQLLCQLPHSQDSRWGMLWTCCAGVGFTFSLGSDTGWPV